MSNQIKPKIESRQQTNKKIKNKNIFSFNTLESLNKDHTQKKIYKDLSLNFLKNYSTTSLTNKTCVNHSHKKIIIKEKSKINNNKKYTLNINNNHNKLIKFPLKLNYKQSVSLKNLIEEENILNPPLRSSDKRKNTTIKIELFSTNSTLSFLNIKDNNKDTSKPVKIKCLNNNNKNKNIIRKNFSSTFIQKKIKENTKSNSKIKIKHIKNNLSLDKASKINLQKNKNKIFGLKDNIFNNSNKSIEFCLSYMKPINKRRNLSIGLYENSNSNTNSIKELYHKKINHKNLDSSNYLLDNMSFSLNKNKNINNNDLAYNGHGNGYRSVYNLFNKINFNTYYKNNSIKNNSKKKFNLSSLPNLLCNNYMNMHNFTMTKNDIYNKEKNKKCFKLKNNKNIFALKNINNKKYVKINNMNYNNDKNKNSNKKIYTNNNGKGNSNEIKEGNTNPNNAKNVNIQLNNIQFGIKFLLDGLYSIYLNANKNKN